MIDLCHRYLFATHSKFFMTNKNNRGKNIKKWWMCVHRQNGNFIGRAGVTVRPGGTSVPLIQVALPEQRFRDAARGPGCRPY